MRQRLLTATNTGLYPQVFNNAVVDGSFGITSKIFWDQITPFGWLLNSLGRVFGNFVRLWATTSTVSGSGDQGADPNQLLITDFLKNTDPAVATKETFSRFGRLASAKSCAAFP